MAIEASDYTLYEANELNQYTSIQENEDAAFSPPSMLMVIKH